MTKRRIAIAVAAVVLVAGVVAGRERPTLDLVEAAAPAAAAARDGIDLSKLRRGESPLPSNDPFKRMQGEKPAQAKTAAEKPTAPALPFQYFGRLTENGRTDVFVMHGEELIAVEKGKTIGEYRVDQVAESSISFTYLPLKTKQTLDFQ
ncbi:MAG TPA: hypothetical protein VJQ58_14380 [Burkholderiales bacterium]|nr:hypothetical protein [Burkholderiales bacterium]